MILQLVRKLVNYYDAGRAYAERVRKLKNNETKKNCIFARKKIYMTIEAKPFIKWVGGKIQLIESIKKSLPEDFSEKNNITYIEPFVGGCAFLF